MATSNVAPDGDAIVSEIPSPHRRSGCFRRWPIPNKELYDTMRDSQTRSYMDLSAKIDDKLRTQQEADRASAPAT